MNALIHRSNSSNHHTYSERDRERLLRDRGEYFFAEVLVVALRRVRADAESEWEWERVSPPEYGITVTRVRAEWRNANGQRSVKQIARFTYRPTRKPDHPALPERTLTRLVRDALQETT